MIKTRWDCFFLVCWAIPQKVICSKANLIEQAHKELEHRPIFLGLADFIMRQNHFLPSCADFFSARDGKQHAGIHFCALGCNIFLEHISSVAVWLGGHRIIRRRNHSVFHTWKVRFMHRAEHHGTRKVMFFFFHEGS
jgi:hypothetical protein